MTIDTVNHPCFNAKVRHKFGRVHLPVAPRCNIQCKFCDRKFDCVNESRPGVSSGILSPYQALVYLDHVFEEKKNISVVGIAGPGDPFANPEETMETLRLVRMKHKDVILCLATNGLGVGPYIDELKALNVGHVTITINAVDPDVATKIYSWVRNGKRVLPAEEGVRLLMNRQIEAVKELKRQGITVKVNTIMIPGINDDHIVEVARAAGELDVDIFNCIPYYTNAGSAFAHIPEPSREDLHRVRSESSRYIRQMTHCVRCRADAVGCLGEKESPTLMQKLKACESMPERPDSERNLIAVASMEGFLVNQHLGQADELYIYKKSGKGISLVETRKTPDPGSGVQRWNELADLLSDCRSLLVGGVGHIPKTLLTEKGIRVHEIEGLIEDAVLSEFEGRSMNHLKKRDIPLRAECSGAGMGCG